VARVLPSAVLRELREGRVSSAAAVVTALAFTSAGYVRGKLPGATSGVRMPAAQQSGATPVPRTPPPASGAGQNLAAQTPTTSSAAHTTAADRPAPSPDAGG
jgi:hypothetical protein